MERAIIESMVASIPLSELGSIAEDHQIWEETEGTTHFNVTRHPLPTGHGHEIISLSVSGSDSEKLRIIKEFEDVLGPPEAIDAMGEIDFIVWLISPVDQPEQ